MLHTHKISSHSQWQPLKEVLIGGSYPDHFYQHLGNKTHDIFARITEITQRDFDRLNAVLTALGVLVRRPEFNQLDHYLDDQDRLLKPPISPCDNYLVLGNTLYINPQYPSGVDPYQSALEQYQQNQQNVHIIDRSGSDPWAWVVFPSVVRAGCDVLIDYNPHDPRSHSGTMAVATQLSGNYRVHLSGTGDHNDGVFCPIQPGHIFTSHYRSVYQQSFPDWKIFHLSDTTVKNIQYLDTHQKWWLPGIDYAHFNHQINQVAETWLGYPQETVFEVNMLVVDEKNIVCGAYDAAAFRYFEQLGITPHLVDFESRYFWDAGIHCLTADIYREGLCEDYWTGRGDNGVYTISEWD